MQNRLLAKGVRLPVIFITVYPGSNAREHALASGALGVLNKPFNEDNLIACLDQALARS